MWGPTNLNLRMMKEPRSEPEKFFQSLRKDFPIISKLYDRDNPIEKVHQKFLKMVLGVHPRTTNIALYGETGRYPILIDQTIAVVKYQHHLEFSSENKLLNRFYDNLKKKNRPLIREVWWASVKE